MSELNIEITIDRQRLVQQVMSGLCFEKDLTNLYITELPFTYVEYEEMVSERAENYP